MDKNGADVNIVLMTRARKVLELASAGQADTVAELVLQRILCGTPAAGVRLTEREIVAMAGCTHAAARDAIRRLERIGAVRFSQRRGASVIGPQDAPPEEIEPVWSALLTMLEELAGCHFEPEGTDFLAVRAALRPMGLAAGDVRLSDLLERMALHRAIVTRIPA